MSKSADDELREHMHSEVVRLCCRYETAEVANALIVSGAATMGVARGHATTAEFLRAIAAELEQRTSARPSEEAAHHG